ncbi:T9SS type A sorting domain-containing protein [Sediminibacterium roseum]|uniref:T9SS type A sorting domain-containing protein n=2 Tax=Sediminibacterium roseum TaxID=1978412 RepID=A0ABX0A3C3_9BACT|nr:T9SS type A sorting domain-containing protein [Sediminibacterium roseum]
MLSSTTTANPVFTPTRGGSFTFTVTVKNALGCTNTATITICVTDIRVFATATPPSNNNCGHQSHYSWNCPHGGHGHSCSHGSHNSYNCPDKEDQDDKQGMCNHQSHNSYDCPHKGHNHTCNHRSHTSYNCSHRSCNDRDDDDDHQRTCNHQSHTSSDCSHRGHNHASCNHQWHSSYNCPHSGNSNDQKVCNHQSHSSGDCNHNGHNHGNCNHRSHSSSDCPHNGGNGGTDDDDEKKVYICHVPPGNPAQRMTLSIGISAVAAHLENHPGDRLGSCDQAPCSGYTDNVKPVIDCSDNVTIAYGSSTSPAVTGSPEADDNSGDVTITYTDASTKGSDATAANYYNYVITRTWKATDLAGNYATCVQTITVTETTKPVITCPGSTTVACGSTAPSVAGTATATDNSGVVNITYTDAVSGNKTTRTWKATDPSGNYATCTQTITVVDNVAPVLTEPNDITVNCGTSTLPAATGTATATDNCSNVTITYTDVAGTNKITRTWKATDASGNYSTDVQVITIVDLVKPTITAPADISISCSASTTPSYCGGNATASDNCSSVSISYSDSKTGNVITRTWKATDASGNFATDTQTITITDNTKPVISVPGAISLSCGSSTTPSGCNSMATATDNCSTPVVTYSDAVNGNKITRTWTATDAAGNFSTGTQIITIVDNTKPTLTVPSAVTVNCGSSTLPAATGTAMATDACSTPVVTYTDATSGNVITRTWKAVDAAGNTTTAAQYITVGVPFTANITSVPTNSTYTGGVSTNLYLGYGAQSTTLTMCSLPSSGAPYTYAWSGSFVNKLSSTTAASPLFTPGVSGYFTFNVTVTNKYGCTSFATISICVTDIRVPGTNGSKVYMCHTAKYKAPQTIQVALSQVSSHLSSSTCGSDGNDRLGSCDQAPCNSVNEVSAPIVVNKTTATGESAEAVATTEEELKVTVMPNPSTTYFTLKMESKYETPISMRVMDANGRVVDAKTKIGANSTIQIGHNYASGTYYAELVQGTKRKVIQLIKARG